MKGWLIAAALLSGGAALALRRIDGLERRESELEGEVGTLRNRESELERREGDLEETVRRLTDRERELEARLDELQRQFEAERDRAQAETAARLVAEQNAQAEASALRLRLGAAKQEHPSGPRDGPQTVTSFAELLTVARDHLDRVIIPDSAERDLHLLDAAKEIELWADEAWRGLRALQEYAEQASQFAGGFWEWCEHGQAEHRWPATQKKLAMSESRTVMESSALRKLREFKIATEVKSNGRVFMGSHLKVVEGGGQNIPRIYFYDDAKGKTAQVHIGFIGPHRLVPNTRTS